MKVILVIVFLIVTNNSFAQEPHPLEFFPHHEGDIFEYQYNPSAPDYFQNIITKDSLGNDGKYYLETTYFEKITVDTLTYEVQWYTTLLFKLDADSGDNWVASVDSVNNRYIQAELVNVFPSYVFGEDVLVKIIDYVGYEIIDSDTLRGLYYRSYYLASKFGIIAEYEDPPFEPTYYLRGAKIDGVTYGTVTSIEEQTNVYPKNFTLLQNYPNPFNPSTTIEYTLSKNSEVTLKIYNLLGEEVKTVVEEFQIKGNYKIDFNARGLSSGVYLYVLSTDKSSISKKMVYIG